MHTEKIESCVAALGIAGLSDSGTAEFWELEFVSAVVLISDSVSVTLLFIDL